jgi:hypothetical protein
MPLFSSKLELSTAASASKIVFADVDLIKGAFKVYPSLSTIQGESVNYFADKQVVMAGDTSRLYQATITPADFITIFADSASFTEFTFTGLSADVPSGTISGSAQIAALGYLLSSQTSSFVLSSQTSSFALKTDVSGAFTSVSSSVSVRLTSLEAGGGSVPSGTISSSQQITDFGFISSSATIASEISGAFTSVSGGLAGRITTLEGTSGGSTDITALNSFTSSAQSNLNALNAATSSYLTATSTSSLALKTDVSGAFTEVSGGLAGRITNLELGGGSVPAGTISSSTQITELGFVNSSQTSSMVVSASLTASFISDAFISASAVRSGFGTATLPSGVLSSSAQIATDISGAFTEVSSSVSTRLTTLETTSGGSTDITALNTFTGSIQSEVNALKAATSSYITSTQTGSFILVSQTSSMSVATASYVSPTFISASAAAAGFGSGGGTTTDITALNTFTASIQTQVDSLTIKTGSYATTGSNTFIGTEIVSGSLKVSGSFVSNNLTYPIVDGVFEGQVLQTDSNGLLTFGNVAAVFEEIYNGEATTLTKGTALYVSGSVGAAPIAYRADASNPARMPVTFVAMENIGAGLTGRGITLGLITGIDLTGYPVGEDLFVNGNGTLTSVRPTGSSDIVQPIGIVTKTGTGGQLNVLNPGPVLLPNITSGKIWVGDSTNYPIEITTSSLSVLSALTASYINPSALPSGLVSSSTQTIANLVGTGILSGSSTVPAGTVSSSAQVVANLVGQNVVVSSITAEQYVVSSSVSYITTSFSSGSTKFGDDLNDTHQFTGSLSITGSLNIGGPFTVNNENLNVSSGSIILTNSSSIVVLDSGIISGTFVGNLNYNYITNLPNLISSSVQIAALGAGLLSSSAQISSQISGAFTSLSASFAARLDSLSVGGGIFQLTGSSYNTTNNIQITGSFSVGTTSFKGFEVNTDGFVVLGNKADATTAPAGTIVYSGSDFYLIV